MIICDICNKEYSSKSSLQRHKNTIHQDIILAQQKKYYCKYCNNPYKYKQSKWSHEKICTKKSISTSSLTPLNNDTTVDKICVEGSQLTLSNIKNSNVNSNNTTNNYYINAFGKEKIDAFTFNNVKEMYNSNRNCLIKFIEICNFNEKYPENHTFCNTSLEGNYVSYVDSHNNKISKMNKNDCYDLVLSTSLENINSILISLKEKMKSTHYNKLYTLIEDTKKSYLMNKKSKDIYKTQINQIAYNERELILKTWAVANFKDDSIIIENIDGSDDESDEDELFKKHIKLDDTVL